MLVITIGSKVKAVLYVCTYLLIYIPTSCSQLSGYGGDGVVNVVKSRCIHWRQCMMFMDDDWLCDAFCLLIRDVFKSSTFITHDACTI